MSRESKPRIQIPNWSELQHYKDRSPPWIKLHRKLLNNRQWADLSGDAAKLLVELWLVAADTSVDGTIEFGTEDLAWSRRREAPDIAAMLIELELGGFVDLSVHDAGTVLALRVPVQAVAIPEGETSGETPRESTNTKTPAVGIVEKSEFTISGLADEAHRILGLGLWWKTELDRKRSDTKSIITRVWVSSGVSLENVHHAIHGLRLMVDRGDVEWLADRKGKPLDGLHVLAKTQALIPGPDGQQMRSLFSAAVDAHLNEQQKSQRQSTTGPLRLHVAPEAYRA